MTSTLKPFAKLSALLCLPLVGLILVAMLLGRSALDNLLAFEVARPKNIAIYLADPRYGLAVNLTRSSSLNNTHPVWSRDGRLTFVSSVILDQDVYTLTLDQLAPINVSRTAHSSAPAWSPSGWLAYVTGHGSEANSIDVLNPDGSLQSYTITQFPNLTSMDSPSWLSDHELVIIGGLHQAQKQVFLLDLDDNRLQNISNEPHLIHSEPLGSPDGERVAFVSTDVSRANGEQMISVWDKASDRLLLVTHNTGLNGELSWSHDGSQLAFASTMSGNSEIYRWDAQTGALDNLSNDAGVDEFASWAANGELAFVSNRSGEAGVYRIDPLTAAIEKVYILHGSSSPVWAN